MNKPQKTVTFSVLSYFKTPDSNENMRLQFSVSFYVLCWRRGELFITSCIQVNTLTTTTVRHLVCGGFTVVSVLPAQLNSLLRQAASCFVLQATFCLRNSLLWYWFQTQGSPLLGSGHYEFADDMK
jgi:hypothetical protein